MFFHSFITLILKDKLQNRLYSSVFYLTIRILFFDYKLKRAYTAQLCPFNPLPSLPVFDIPIVRLPKRTPCTFNIKRTNSGTFSKYVVFLKIECNSF